MESPGGQSIVYRLLVGNRRSALELLAPERYPFYLRITLVRFVAVVGSTAFIAIALPGPVIPGFRQGALVPVFFSLLLASLLLSIPRSLPPSRLAY